MNPYYVARCWDNELKKCEYKVMERRWFQLARYLISIGSLSDQAAEEYENNGYKLERLTWEELIVKSKREAMMNNAFGMGYADGIMSKTWAMFLHDGFIQPATDGNVPSVIVGMVVKHIMKEHWASMAIY